MPGNGEDGSPVLKIEAELGGILELVVTDDGIEVRFHVPQARGVLLRRPVIKHVVRFFVAYLSATEETH